MGTTVDLLMKLYTDMGGDLNDLVTVDAIKGYNTTDGLLYLIALKINEGGDVTLQGAIDGSNLFDKSNTIDCAGFDLNIASAGDIALGANQIEVAAVNTLQLSTDTGNIELNAANVATIAAQAVGINASAGEVNIQASSDIAITSGQTANLSGDLAVNVGSISGPVNLDAAADLNLTSHGGGATLSGLAVNVNAAVGGGLACNGDGSISLASIAGNLDINAADELHLNAAGETMLTTNSLTLTIAGQTHYVRPYRSYVALINQSGSGNPTAKVLENTLGATITYVRLSPGEYQVNASAAVLTANNTTVSLSAGILGNPTLYVAAVTGTSNLMINTIDSPSTGLFDGQLQDTLFEIRVYY